MGRHDPAPECNPAHQLRMGRRWRSLAATLVRRPAGSDGDITDRLPHSVGTVRPRYDRDTGFYDLFLLGDSRSWACSQASGQVLEVAIGTAETCPSTHEESS